jgi:hypothetical protein
LDDVDECGFDTLRNYPSTTCEELHATGNTLENDRGERGRKETYSGSTFEETFDFVSITPDSTVNEERYIS